MHPWSVLPPRNSIPLPTWHLGWGVRTGSPPFPLPSQPLSLFLLQNSSACSGLCSPGFYCPEGSTSPEEVQCGDPTRYCPEGSSHPFPVAPGHFSIGGNVSTRFGQQIASRGFYALNGLLFTCPAGRYGTAEGETQALCTGECMKGFYCPGPLPPPPSLSILTAPSERSISPVMFPCGADDVFCPQGSVAPIAVHSGFYTTFQWTEGCKPGTPPPPLPSPSPHLIMPRNLPELFPCH
jgi:hypothetical protein